MTIVVSSLNANTRLLLSYLGVSRSGVARRDLQQLLTLSESDMEIIEVSARLLLTDHDGLLDLRNPATRRAVLDTCLADESTISKLHTDLAELFESRWRDNDRNALNDLPHHLRCSRAWSKLITLLTDVDFIQMKSAAGMKAALVQDYREAVAAWSRR